MVKSDAQSATNQMSYPIRSSSERQNGVTVVLRNSDCVLSVGLFTILSRWSCAALSVIRWTVVATKEPKGTTLCLRSLCVLFICWSPHWMKWYRMGSLRLLPLALVQLCRLGHSEELAQKMEPVGQQRRQVDQEDPKRCTTSKIVLQHEAHVLLQACTCVASPSADS